VPRSSTTLSSADPGRAATLGRIRAAGRYQQAVTLEQRREITRAAREANAARRLIVAREKAAALGLDSATLSPADLERLRAALVQERMARMQLASIEAARKRRSGGAK
jgi:light-regulated signal transduction histidine kinase (bacteriophytochrome)